MGHRKVSACSDDEVSVDAVSSFCILMTLVCACSLISPILTSKCHSRPADVRRTFDNGPVIQRAPSPSHTSI